MLNQLGKVLRHAQTMTTMMMTVMIMTMMMKLINAHCLCYKNDTFLAAGVMLAVSAGKRPFLLVLAVSTVT